jgi:hypothetical protein
MVSSIIMQRGKEELAKLQFTVNQEHSLFILSSLLTPIVPWSHCNRNTKLLLVFYFGRKIGSSSSLAAPCTFCSVRRLSITNVKLDKQTRKMEEDWDGENEPDNQQGMEDNVEEEEEEEEEDILGGDDDGPETNDKESLLMRFCPHDSSMLYPQVRVQYHAI